jgi:WD40 repeat protein
VLHGHETRVRSVTFNHEGTLVASGSEDKKIKIWDVRSGRCLKTFHGHTNNVWNVSFNHEGTLVASCSDDQTVRIWDIRSGQSKHILQEDSIPWSVAYTHNGFLLSGYENGMIRVRNISQYTDVHMFQAHAGAVRSLALSDDGAILISSCGEDATVKVWNMQTFTCISELNGHTNYVKTTACRKDGVVVASGSDDYSVRVWNVQDGQCMHILTGHTNQVKSVRFSPDGMLLISCGEDEVIKIWDLTTGICLHTLASKRPYEGLNIYNVTGLTDAQKHTLKTLGAIDHPDHSY